MTPRRWLPCFLALLLTSLAGAVPSPDRFAWKFEKGKAFYQTMTTEVTQSMKVMGQDIAQKQKQVFVFGWTPVRQENDGSWVFRQKIEAVALNVNIAGNAIEYDSANPQPGDNALGNFLKALVGAEFLVTVDRNLRVTKVEGREEFIKKLGNSNAQLKPLLESILGEEAIRQMADPAFGAVPAKPVKKGDTWHKESRLSMGPIGTYKTRYAYTYEGAEGSLERISVKTEMDYTAPAGDGGGGLPFKIKKADLKSSDAGGTLLFDPVRGRVERSEFRLKLAGKLTIDIGGMATEVELDQTQVTTVRTSDRLPGRVNLKDK